MFIYLITNLINGKYYVGQTIRSDPQERFKQHCGDARKGSAAAIHAAMRQFGIENFTFEILEQCSSKEELDCAERSWIIKLDSRNASKGYNRIEGGHGWDPNTAAALSVAFSGEGNPFYGKTHTPEVVDKIKQRIKEVAWEPTEEWIAAQRARTGDKNPMFGHKMSEAGLVKMREGWARRRALGLKMNLTEEQREQRRCQAAAMRARKAAQQCVTVI